MAIKKFSRREKGKALEDFFYDGITSGLNPKHVDKIERILDRLDAATKPNDMRLPGYDFHKLEPKNKGRYSVHINGPWCITFEFDGVDATEVDYEQYH